jgi:hypothetical protein
MHASPFIKNGNIYIQPKETRRRTLARLSGLIRLLLPMLAKPKTPAVMHVMLCCAALGLYALRGRSNARTGLDVPLHRTGLPVRMACSAHPQCVLGSSSRRLVQLARHNRGCQGYMRGVQRGRLGEEWHFLVVPVDEDMTRRRDDVGGVPPYGKEMVF